MSAAPAAAGPARLQQVDALRGFALFGILVVNIGVFASPYYGSGVVDPAFGRPLDLAASWVFGLLFETKFYLLFSFLFGYSFTLQMAAAERGQAAFLPRFLRRLAGLAALGAAHAVLFYHGDILLTYAILGLLLLCCRNLSPPARCAWRCGSSDSPRRPGRCWPASLLDPPGPEVAQARADVLSALQAYRGTVGSVIGQHAKELIEYVWVVLLLQGLTPSPCSWSAMRWDGGRRWKIRGASRARWGCWRWACCRAWPARLYAWSALPSVAGPSWELPGLAVGLLTSPLLTMSYACAFLLMLRSRLGARLSAWLARRADGVDQLPDAVRGLRAGVHGLGRASDGLWSPLEAGGLALVIFLAQTAASAWWMRRHAYGPVEWFLRALTVGVWPQWRRTSDARALERRT